MMPNKSLHATRDGALGSASRFTSFGPACLSSGRPLHYKNMIRLLIFTLTLACGLPCMAGNDEHFLHTFGGFTLRDRTNQVSVTASQKSDKPGSVLISWPGYDSSVSDMPPGDYKISDSVPLIADGWFVFAEDATHVWVFDGRALILVTFIGKTQENTTISVSEIDKCCPKEVRDALPKSYYKK